MRCRGGGDITVRHNALRDECFFRCLTAGLDAELEASGLLPDDPRRRPGDVVLRSCPGQGPVALDFAVTCPLQVALRRDASGRQLAAAMAYEAEKLEDRDTAQRCAAQGLKLIPMVTETFGGWGPAAQGFFLSLAKASAERSGTDVSLATCQLYHSMGIRLQRANARAILSRIASTTTSCDYTALAATSRSEAALVLSAATAAPV